MGAKVRMGLVLLVATAMHYYKQRRQRPDKAFAYANEISTIFRFLAYFHADGAHDGVWLFR